jgi:hypothetical protein
MVKKLGILGFILIVVAAAGMVWAETFTGAIPAPTPTVMPAAAPACVGGVCPPPAKVKGPAMKPKGLKTTIDVKMSYPEPPPPMMPMMGCGAPPPIPVAVPMWKFIVPWPPFVYYLPVE